MQTDLQLLTGYLKLEDKNTPALIK